MTTFAFLDIVKNLPAEQLSPEHPIKALIVTVSPRTARLKEGFFDANPSTICEPLKYFYQIRKISLDKI
jgi:hypothetical protein